MISRAVGDDIYGAIQDPPVENDGVFSGRTLSWVGSALVLMGAAGTAISIVAPITHTESGVGTTLSGWTSPPLTFLLVGLVSLFAACGIAMLRGCLHGWQRAATPFVIALTFGVVLIVRGTIADASSDWIIYWGLGVVLASTLVGTLGYIACVVARPTSSPVRSGIQLLVVTLSVVAILAWTIPDLSSHQTSTYPGSGPLPPTAH